MLEGEGKVGLCQTMSGRGRPAPERAGEGRETDSALAWYSYTKVGLCKRLKLNPPQACTMFYAIEIVRLICSAVTLQSSCNHPRFTDEEVETQR